MSLEEKLDMYKLESSADYYLGRQLLTFDIESEIFIKSNDCFINFDTDRIHMFIDCI